MILGLPSFLQIIVEDEDGEVVKQYDLPVGRGEGRDYVATSLKYMGMSGLKRPMDKESKPTGSSQGGEPSGSQEAPVPAPAPAPIRRASAVNWVGFGRLGNAEKKNDGAEASQDQVIDDDRGIRFTISGDGKRMTKEDFLREIQKLERSNREVAGVPRAPKDAAGPSRTTPGQSDSPQLGNPHINVTQASDSTRDTSKSPARPTDVTRGRSGGRGAEEVASSDTPENAVERRRRLAAFATVKDDDTNETPAERRRREAALGVTGSPSEESDSEDDGAPRVPPERRGIRFAEGPARRA